MKNLDLAESGYSIIVTNEVKESIHKWTPNQKIPFTPEQVLKQVKRPEAKYLALVCGFNNVEIIDVDLKVLSTEKAKEEFWNNLIKSLDDNLEGFYQKTVIVKTVSGGYHIIYRNEKRDFCDRNTDLARLNGCTEQIIETRGDGGYAIIYDLEGNDYSRLKTLQPITKEEKDIIFAVCRSFNEIKEKEPVNTTYFKKVSNWTGGKTPWDDYNERVSVWDLISNDFTIVGENNKSIQVLRNGSKAAHSGYIFKDTNTLYLFSSNARVNNCELKQRTIYTPFKLFCLTQNLEYSEGAKELLKNGFGIKGENLKSKKSKTEITDYNEIQVVTEEKPNEEAEAILKISYWIKNHVKLKSNEVTRRIVFQDSNEILTGGKMKRLFVEAKLITPKISKDVFDCLVTGDNPDFIPVFNPFKEFIELNKGIETNNELEALKSTIITDTLNASVWIEKWYLGLFAAIDGKPVRNVLALLGGQNTGKTEWFRRLLPDDLLKYYAESKLDREKDDELLMCEKLIINDDEMGGKSKEDEKKFKMLSSKSVFTLRAPYGVTNEDYKRLAVLCGTSNDLQVINDPTGNTRILGVQVLKIDHEAFNKIDKTRLFIDGYKKYIKDKDQYLLNKDDLKILEASGNEFKTIAIEEELILRYLKPTDNVFNFMTATEIKEYLEDCSSKTIDPATGYVRTKPGTKIVNMKNFGIYLKKHFGDPVSKYDSGKGNSVRVYYVETVENYRHLYNTHKK
jgi:hypothetical protein